MVLITCRKKELIARSELVLPWRPFCRLVKECVYSHHEQHGLVLLPPYVPPSVCLSVWSVPTHIMNNRLRPIPVLGIGIGPIPAVSGGIWYRRYCSRYRPIPVGGRCNDKMPKYRVDRLISLPTAMAANGVHSSMHNQPCGIMLFTAFYKDLPRRATTIAGRAPTSKVPRNSPHSADAEPDAIDLTS